MSLATPQGRRGSFFAAWLSRFSAEHRATGYVAYMEADSLGSPPNCEQCLVPMVVEGLREHPFWRCPSCDLVRLS
jgi:hypothetical protein